MPKRELERRINQTPTGAVAGGVLVVPSSASIPPTAGADIRVSGYRVDRAGNGVLLFSGSGALLTEYAYTEAGLAAAFAAAAAGDVVDLPAGTLTATLTVPAGVTLRGMGAATVIAGAVTLKGRLKACRVTRTANSGDVLAGIVAGSVGDVGIIDDDVIVDVQNSGGPAYAVYMVTGGDITVKEGDLLAEVGTDGYAAYVTSGAFRHERGAAKGTTALTPYWMET
jgi:hypothetical protein